MGLREGIITRDEVGVSVGEQHVAPGVLGEPVDRRRGCLTRQDVVGNLLALGGLTGLVLGLSDAGLDGWSAPMVVGGAA